MKPKTLKIHDAYLSPDRKSIAIEPYPDGSGWFAHFPVNGRVLIIKASAETSSELIEWAEKQGLLPTLI